MHLLEFLWKKGTSRYYHAIIQKDLFNDLILTFTWGGIDSRLGNKKTILLQTIEEGLEKIKEINLRRLRRGYISIINSIQPTI